MAKRNNAIITAKMKVKLPDSKWPMRHWKPITAFTALLIGFGWLSWWQLGTLTGYSPSELQSLHASTNLSYILHHPLNAPYTLLAHALLSVGNNSLLMMRLTSAIFGVLGLGIFFWLARYWFGLRASVFGTIVFGASAWFLHVARLGTPDVLLFMLLALVAAGLWLKHRRGVAALFVCFVLAAALVYVPGMIWFVGAGIVWQWKTIDKIFNKQLWMVSLGALIILAALAPLGWAIFKTPQLAKELVGLPLIGWPQPLHVLQNIAHVPLNIFLRGPLQPEHWLGRLPILDAFCIAMLGLGVYVFWRHVGLSRTKLMAAILLIGTLLVGLGGDVSLSVIVPFVYLAIAAGIGFMLDRWWAVFPRNVIAQGVGVGLISIAVLISGWYGYRHYFVAWPNAPATKAVFTVRPSDTMK